MRKLLVSALTAGVVGFGTVAPAMANPTYVDSNMIGEWSKDYVGVLQDLDILVGYPDGTFRPAANITREEFAVALVKAMVAVEDGVYAAMEENNQALYQELVDQQTQILALLAEVDEVKARDTIASRNWVGISLGYSTEGGSQDDDAFLSIDGRITVLDLTDSLTISVRPFVNTSGEAGGGATVDYAINDKFTVYGGAGAAGSWSDSSVLAGSDEVVGYGQAGVEYNFNNKTGVYLDTKVPFTGDNSGDVNVGAGFKVNF